MNSDLNIKVILMNAREIAEKNGYSSQSCYTGDTQQISRNKFLSMNERSVFNAMFDWFYATNIRAIGRDRLAFELGVSEKTITRATKKLEELEFIKVARRKNKTNIYTLLDFSLNPFVVLSNVIRKREFELSNSYEGLGLETEERIQKIKLTFGDLWEKEEYYNPFVSRIKEGLTDRERYYIAEKLVAHWEQYGAEIHESSNVISIHKPKEKRKVKKVKRKVKVSGKDLLSL
ncbi:hypothetical protein [Bacillus sp. 166amftsu]|uniref:hypothetical protein n=1 Tax=Bacillus sp. 166amftsu TaxID=1761753 RepID=UPI000898101F|nr:hypothetical protein [Bacillus sp. 166amftsu]SDZ45573.1 hypothetical protein SAMN04488156_1527 [Bacillus sp. 166amftsu]